MLKTENLRFFSVIFTCLVTLFNVGAAKAATQIDITGPVRSGSFGMNVAALPNGNIVVVDTGYDGEDIDVGAVYLYNGATGALISSLTGDKKFDKVGSFGITVLPSGNYLVVSQNWHSDTGAVTFCSKTSGCSGKVSSANSLIGTLENDRVGWYGATVLSNGNYVIGSPYWNGQRGAFTWGNGMTGITGEVSASNSMVGTVPGERVGTGMNGNKGITPLANGNYVAVSSAWNDNRGAATFCNGTMAGCVGNITSANSLVGSTPLDSVGIGGILELKNGNYLVRSFNWNSGTVSKVGAITWGSGISGVIGEVSSTNSLVGTVSNEQIGNSGSGTVALTNGNYVVLGPRGATFGNGTTGTVSPANSLVGSVGDDFYLSSVVALANGNYVVVCPYWDLNAATPNAGAVTFGNGTTGTIGTISVTNSLVGDGVNSSVGSGGVIPLTNGNYVVRTEFWNASRGAVTWGSGTTGVTGTVSAANSLVGSTVGDRIGEDGVTALANGNYVVSSSDWYNGTIFNAGAVTFGSGETGIAGIVSVANSLVGSHSNDKVGNVGVLALPNGNYVVRSPEWNEYRGAATFGNGVTGITGEVSAANSLVGSNPNDYVCYTTNLLANGNYVVVSHNWNAVRGAVTFGNAATGVSGVVSASNSLVGSNPNDRVGGGNNLKGVVTLPNGNYVIPSPNWGGDLGAVTWGNGTTGISGVVSASNSLIGSTALDLIGNGSLDREGITAMPDSNYVVFSPVWDNGSIVNAGAVSLGKANEPLTGAITTHNSVRGTAPNYGSALVFDYDTFNKQLVVGRQGSNIVTIFRYETPKSIYDFDGDGRTDYAVYRPSAGEWWYLRSSDGTNRAFQFGNNADKIVPADYTGDGKTDVAFFRPSTGEWFILRSEDSSFYSAPFGTTGDIPVPADFDGDGKTDIAVFRPSEANWYINRSSGGFSILQFGANGDIPLPADFDGDSKADLAVYRPSVGEWWMLRSSDGGNRAFQFGNSTDKPVPADYTGDGKTDVAFYRPSTSEWFVLRSEDGSFYSAPFGAEGDIPIPGDYDGDGKVDIAVWRASDTNWYVAKSSGGFSIAAFGSAGDKPIPSAFVP